MIKLMVLGVVARWGEYSLPSGSRLSDAIAKAGGFTESSYRKGVWVKHPDGRTYTYDLRKPTKDEVQNPVLHDADVVIVPRWMRPVL